MKNFGIKQSNCKFYVDKEKRTVVCVIPYTRYILWNFLKDNTDYINFNIFAGFIDSKKGRELLVMPNSFMGKAVCAESDEWNEELGRLIAFSRAKDKCYRSFFTRAQHLFEVLDGYFGDTLETFNKLGMRLDDKKKGLEQKIEEMLGTTQE